MNILENWDSPAHYKKPYEYKQKKRICPLCEQTFYTTGNAKYCCSQHAAEARQAAQRRYFNEKYYPENRDKLIEKAKERRKKGRET